MGDFNDEPFDTSLVRYALSTRQRAKVTSARENPLLWNLMWPNAGLPDGSFYFETSPTCSTCSWSTRTWPPPTLGSRSTPTRHKSSNRLPWWSIQVTTQSQSHTAEWGDLVNQNGFSDHFPITMTVTEDD
jgi:hypothetical protein